jgi:glycosyltransferase involved in cell wall biosynthesis
MYRTYKVAIVVPAFNEQERIAFTLIGIPSFVDAVYVVDDASTDRTADIVRDFVARHPVLGGSNPRPATRNLEPVAPAQPANPGSAGELRPPAGEPRTQNSEPRTPPCGGELRTQNAEHRTQRVELVQHAVNLGVGAAIVTGYKRALHDDMDIAVVMAGDNQMDPEELPGLLDPIVDGRADYTKGDRTSCRVHLVGMPRWRRIGNWLLCWLTCIAIGTTQVKDPQNGYTAASRDLLAELPLDTLYPRYGYCNQMLAWVSAYHKRVVEVPMPARYLGEKSKIRYRTYIPTVLWLLMRLTAARLVLWRTAGLMRPYAARGVSAYRVDVPERVSSPAPVVARES